MLPKLIGYVVWLPGLVGLGSALFLTINRTIKIVPDFANFEIFAVGGLAILGTVATILNFFVAIAPPIPLIALAAGWFLLLRNRKVIASSIGAESALLSFPRLLLVVTMLLFTAYYTQRGFIQGDVGWYHFPTLKWIASSQLPLGLAQLNSRFGYNFEWFSVASMMEVVSIGHQSAFIVNGLLLWVFGIVSWDALIRVFKKDLVPSTLFMACSVVTWIVVIFFSPKEIGPFTPNFPVALLAILSTYTVLKGLESAEGWLYYTFVAAFIALFAILCKFSSILLILAPLVILLYKAYQRRQLFWPGALKPLIPLALIMFVPWMIRGIMLSGCLLYPIQLTCIAPLPWTVSPGAANAETTLMFAWARQRFVAPETVLSSWNWLSVWWPDTFDQWRFRVLLLTVAAGVFVWIVALIKRRNTTLKDQQVFLLAAVVPVIGCLFWFFTAPDVKYGYGSMGALAQLVLCSAVYALWQSGHIFMPLLIRFTRRAAVLAPYALLLWIGLKVGVTIFRQERDVLFEWPTLLQVQVREKATDNGAIIYIPDTDDHFCWDAPLPCADNEAQALEVQKDAQGHITMFSGNKSINTGYGQK